MSMRYRQPEPEPCLHTQLPLAALGTAPACARGHLKAVALEWGIGKEQRETAELLVSELVTNGLLASLPERMPRRTGWLADHAPSLELRLTRRPGRMRMEVWDASPYPPPRPGTPDHETENGRGLFMVQELSLEWGWYFPALVSETDPPVLGHGRFRPAPPRSIEAGQRLLTGKVVWCELTASSGAATLAAS
jgi:anti-sigma regulatory factor (Ser/Thr protein kinase)